MCLCGGRNTRGVISDGYLQASLSILTTLWFTTACGRLVFTVFSEVLSLALCKLASCRHKT